MFTQLDLIFLRHAETEHNRLPSQFKKQDIQNSEQVKKFGNFEEIKDQHITPLGRQQCKAIAETLNWDSISLIIVSPLRSCLDTCKVLLQESKRNIPVQIEPLISGKIENEFSIGSPKAILEKQYPQFCFSNLEECNRLPWYLQNLCVLKKKRIQQLKEPLKFLQKGIKQDYFEFRRRILNFQRILKSRMHKLKQGQRILIISHNEVFKMITAKFFICNGKCMSDIDLKNAQINYASSCQVFQPLSPAPIL